MALQFRIERRFGQFADDRVNGGLGQPVLDRRAARHGAAGYGERQATG
ncbi:MAG: hypothetical protein ACM30E_08755 [Nitrososphaerales archaeon]